jgi:hypothetical protein
MTSAGGSKLFVQASPATRATNSRPPGNHLKVIRLRGLIRNEYFGETRRMRTADSGQKNPILARAEEQERGFSAARMGRQPRR